MLELKSDQLVCKNNDGEKTAWLDSLGNFNLTGILNQMKINVTDANFAYYFEIINNDMDNVICSRKNDVLAYIHDKIIVPDMMRISGVVNIDALTTSSLGKDGYVNLDLLLPYFLPMVYDGANSQYDVMRTRINEDGAKRYISFSELQALVGREIEISTSKHPIYLHFPKMTQITSDQDGMQLYRFDGYVDHDYSIMQSSVVRFIYKSGIIENDGERVGYGVFPMCVSFGEYINPSVYIDGSDATEIARNAWDGAE